MFHRKSISISKHSSKVLEDTKKLSDRMKQLKSLVKYNFPSKEKITVRKHNEERKNISNKEYNNLFGIHLSHGIFYMKEQEPLVKAMKKSLTDTADAAKVRNFLNNPKHYFNVEYLNSTFGYALVANQDIPKGAIVGIYGGELLIKQHNEESKETREERAYDMTLLKKKLIEKKIYDVSLRANQISDITRFAPHAPSEDDLDFLSLDSTIESKNIVTANLNYPMAVVDGNPIRYYITSRAIKKGEFGAIDYGHGYWESRGQPDLLESRVNGYRVTKYSTVDHTYLPTNETISFPFPPQPKPTPVATQPKSTQPNSASNPHRKFSTVKKMDVGPESVERPRVKVGFVG